MEATLFYSNFCNSCSKIKEYKLFNSISKICIDNVNIRKKLPSYISQVPTILIKHHEELQLLTGGDAEKWFNMAEQSNIPIKPLNTNPDYSPQTQLDNELNNNSNHTNNISSTQNNTHTVTDNLKPVNDMLEGFSGGFSYIDNNINSNNNNNNYSFLDNTENTIETPQESQSTISNKKNCFEKDYESMLLRRQKI